VQYQILNCRSDALNLLPGNFFQAVPLNIVDGARRHERENGGSVRGKPKRGIERKVMDMKRKLGVVIILLLALMASSIYIDVPTVKAPSAPVKIHNTPTIVTEDNISVPKTAPSVSQQAVPVAQEAAPVLKQVTAADMQALDLRLPCGFTAAEIESVTKYDLKGLGADFAGEDGKVNAVFLMSVAALESGWGRYKINQYNLFGMYNYSPQSYSQCIDHVADVLAANYLTPGGKWFNGDTISGVNKDYCVNPDGSPRTSWTNEVSGIMAGMYNQIYQAEYQQKT
jgi:hypothetical protein